MTLLLAAVVGFLAGRLAWVALRSVFDQPLFARTNHRGVDVPVGAGMAIAAAVIAVEAVRLVVDGIRQGAGVLVDAHRLATLLLVVGLCLLGLFDDLAGTAADKGFRGHLRALARGRLTTGGLKLLGGGAVAVAAVATVEAGPWLVADAALVALAANLGNLFDRAPGRTLKVAGLAAVVLVAATLADPVLAPVVVVVAAGLALVLDDLHEHLMLGDTGANALGGALGFGVVLAADRPARVAVLVVLVVLNLASERVSFSRVIDAVPPLRALDRAGRRPSPASPATPPGAAS